MAQMVKRLPAMQETRVQSLDQEDPLEKEVATHSSILVWKIPWMEEPGRLQPMGLQRVGHDWAASLSLEIFYQKILAGPNGKKLWKHMIWAVWKWPDMSESKYLDTFG